MVAVIRYPRTNCFQVRSETPLVGTVALFFSPYSLLSINLNILVSFTGKMYFVVCDVSRYLDIKRSDRV